MENTIYKVKNKTKIIEIINEIEIACYAFIVLGFHLWCVKYKKTPKDLWFQNKVILSISFHTLDAAKWKTRKLIFLNEISDTVLSLPSFYDSTNDFYKALFFRWDHLKVSLSFSHPLYTDPLIDYMILTTHLWILFLYATPFYVYIF